MKKIDIFIVLGLMTFSSSLIAVKEKQKLENESVTKQFTKKDMFKIGAASFGCAWFSTAAIMAYNSKNSYSNGMQDKLIYKPSMISAMPLYAFSLLFHASTSKLEDNIYFGLAGIGSAITSYMLGSYVYKKLSQLKSKK